MADKKELALSLKIDTRQGETKLLPFAQKTTAIFEKLAKVAGNVKLGILGGGNGGDFAKAAKHWGDLGTIFAKLTGAVQANGRALDEERKRLADLRREAEATARALEGAETRLNATRKFGIGFADAESHHGAAQSAHQSARAAADAQEEVVAKLAKGGGGGIGAAAIAGAAGALAYTILKDLPNTLDAGDFRNVSNRARIGSSTGSLSLRAGQRDFTDLIAMSQIGGDSARAGELANVSDPDSFRRQIQKGFHMVGGLIPGSGISIGDTFSMFGGNSREGLLFQKALSDEAAVKYIQQQALSDPRTRLGAQQYSGQSQDHLGFMRAMGMGEGESNAFLASVRGQTGGKFGIGSMLSMAEGIAASGGGRGGGASLTSDALQVVISGMDQGVVSQMAGAFAAGGSGSAMLNHLRAVSGTSMDMFAAQRAGSFVAANYLNGNNLNSGEGLMSFMTSGFTGGSADSFFERKREEALGGFQGIMGADPYQQTIGYVNALRVGRRGGLSLAGVNKLATLDTNSILQAFRNKAPDGGLGARGINNSMILDEFNGNVDALAVRNLALGGNDPESVLARRLKGSSMSNLLMSLKSGDLDAGSALLSDAMPQVFKSDAVAKQFILGLQGAARGDESGFAPGDAGTGSAALGADQRAFKQEFELFTKAQGDLREALKISGTNVHDFAQEAARATSVMTKIADLLGIYGYGLPGPDRSTAGPAGDGN